MWHHIFRNLWNSRKRNVWILLELIVIAIVCWMVIDPLFVIFYNKSIPDGYEADGLYRLQLSVVPSDEEIRPEDFRKLMERLRSHEQIESATYVVYNPQIQISAESETKRSIFREKDKTKRSKKESAQHSKSRNKSFVMTSVSAL